MIWIRLLSFYFGIVFVFFMIYLSQGFSKTKSKIVVILTSPILLLTQKGRETLMKRIK